MGFFNQRKPRQFRHEPIYYDPRKEELEERVQKVKKEMGLIDEKDYKPNIKGAFIEQSQHVRRRQANKEKSSSSRNIKLGVVLAILLILFWYFYLR